MSRVDDFLMHYVEQAYDPVKAHEYYLKNRDLKGRSTSGMSDAQKEAWTYVKNNVDEDKKKEVEISKVANEQKIEVFRAATAATRKRISDKLKLLSEQLSDKSANDREDISDKLKLDIENVADIPKGITGKHRDILVEKRNKEIARIQGNASKHTEHLSKNINKERQTNSDAASIEREKTSSDLKAIISKTRDDYNKSKDTLKASYETIYAKEYKKVIDTVKGKPKATSKSKPKATSKSTPKENGLSGKAYFDSLPFSTPNKK